MCTLQIKDLKITLRTIKLLKDLTSKVKQNGDQELTF